MIKDFIDSISDYTKTRISNPFFETLLFVWAVRNFDFIFVMFNFAEGVTLTQKIDYIHRYFEVYGTWVQLSLNIVISFGVLLASFLLLFLARFLTNLYSNILNWLNSKTAKVTMIDKTVYQTLYEDYQIIKDKYEKLKIEESTFNKILNDKDNDLFSLKSSQLQVSIDLEKNSDEKQKLEIRLSELSKKYDKILLENAGLVVDKADKQRLLKFWSVILTKVNIDKHFLEAYVQQHLLNTPSLALSIRRDLLETILAIVHVNLWREVILINQLYNMNFNVTGSINLDYVKALIGIKVLVANNGLDIDSFSNKVMYKDLSISLLGMHCMEVLESFYMEQIIHKTEINSFYYEIE